METMESSKLSKEQVYDEVRDSWVAATPEEIVRQKLLKKMIYKLSYPRELIVVEKALSEIPLFSSFTGSLPIRRIDIACFAKGIVLNQPLSPLLIIECKEDKRGLDEALEQVKGYNHYLKAYFIAVAHPEGEVFGFVEKGAFHYIDYLPSYSTLIQSIHHAH